MKTTDSWARIGAFTPDHLIDTSLQLHWAAQFIASAGQTFAEPRDDDSHRAMTWDATLDAFVSAPFAGTYPFRLALRPTDLTLLLLDRGAESLSTFALPGRTRDEGYAWLSRGMATYMGGAPPLIERPEYDVPEHPVRGDAPFSEDRGEELHALAALYGSAAEILHDRFAGREDASETLCWPHHFDLATLVTVEIDDEGGVKKSIGIGLAPMGGGYDTWYWYVTPWPYPDPEALPELRSSGFWHTEGWVGAILPGTSVTEQPERERADTVRGFVDAAVDAARRSLS